MVTSITKQLARAYEDRTTTANTTTTTTTTSTGGSSNFEGLKSNFKDLLKQATISRPLLIFIDSLDQLSDEDLGRSDLSWLPFDLPLHCHLVVSTLPTEGGCLNALRATNIPNDNYLEVTAVAEKDAETIMRDCLKGVNRTLQPQQLRYVLGIATDSTQEPPTMLRLRLLFDLAAKQPSYHQIETLNPSVRLLISAFFDKLALHHGRNLLFSLFHALDVSQHGLGLEVLSDLCATEQRTLSDVFQYHKSPIQRVPQVVFARLRNDLGDYIVERGVFGWTVWAWYHRQFWEAAKRKFARRSDTEVYARLDAYFSEKSKKRFRNRGLPDQPIYWINPATGQVRFNMIKLSLWMKSNYFGRGGVKVMLETLCDLQYLCAKLTAGMGRLLIVDLFYLHSRCGNRASYMPYYDLVVSKYELLESNPDLILQSAINMPTSKMTDDIRHQSMATVAPWIHDPPALVTWTNKPEVLHPFTHTLTGHTSPVTDIAIGFIRSGGVGALFSSSLDGHVIAWNSLNSSPRMKINMRSPVHRVQCCSTALRKYHVFCSMENGSVKGFHFHANEESTMTIITDFQAYDTSLKLHHVVLGLAQSNQLVTGSTRELHDGSMASDIKLWMRREKTAVEICSIDICQCDLGQQTLTCLEMSPGCSLVLAALERADDTCHVAAFAIEDQSLQQRWSVETQPGLNWISTRQFDVEIEKESDQINLNESEKSENQDKSADNESEVGKKEQPETDKQGNEVFLKPKAFEGKQEEKALSKESAVWVVLCTVSNCLQLITVTQEEGASKPSHSLEYKVNAFRLVDNN